MDPIAADALHELIIVVSTGLSIALAAVLTKLLLFPSRRDKVLVGKNSAGAALPGDVTLVQRDDRSLAVCGNVTDLNKV